MYKRQMAAAIEKAGQYFPIITILGARQSGKTTLAQTLYPEKPYINLERLDVRMQALEDPNRFIRQFPNGAIFDEIQEAPTLLSYLMVFVDEIKKNNLFILTESHQTKLKEGVSQSLVGRTVIFRLLPLSLSEINTKKTIEEATLYGGYPRAHALPFPLS